MPAHAHRTAPAGENRPGFRPTLETLEDRTVLSASLPDVDLRSATTRDSHGVTFQYALDRTVRSFDVAVYRSADDRFDSADQMIETVRVNASTRDDAGRVANRPGLHRLTAAVDLPQDPDRPYVLVVADPSARLSEGREDNNVGSFRKHLIGVVTHGFSLEPGVPAYATAIADALDEQGYDVAFAFDWSLLSKIPAPGLSTLAAGQLALRISATAAALDRGPGDVVDLHVIGHSRGTVVNSLAVERVAGGPLLRGGWVRETMLDPHPSRNLLPFAVAAADVIFGSDGFSQGGFFAYRPGPLGVVPMLVVLAFQEAVNDPVPRFTAGVDQAEVFYQNTPGVKEPFNLADMDTYANAWGYRPSMIPNLSGTAVAARDLTGIYHFDVPFWYLENLDEALAGA